MNINPIKIEGNWRYGWALDLHTVESTLLPDGSFDTKRTDLGEFLYQIKYRSNINLIISVSVIAADFIRKLDVFPYLASIIPIPPSDLNRPFQPVFEITIELGKRLNLPAPIDYLIKVRKTTPLKCLEDHNSRHDQLKDAFTVKDQRFKGKYVLLFDDIYRSGETLRSATEVLYNNGLVSRVFVLTLTKTRTKR
ncbi:ComF family protein [bacterium]|nr:ComF family protein [FCB group bacterium]MBL7190825.1 ComF family protein [bacterium]